MRGLIAVVSLCGMALLTGCADTTVASRSGAPAAEFVPGASASVAPDPNVKAVCDDLRTSVLGADATQFGTQLGKLMAARAQGDRAGEGQARQAAVATLSQISGKLRAHARETTDPRLRYAMTASAANLDKMGADVGALANLDSLDAVGKTTGRFAAALGDAAEYCDA